MARMLRTLAANHVAPPARLLDVLYQSSLLTLLSLRRRVPSNPQHNPPPPQIYCVPHRAKTSPISQVNIREHIGKRLANSSPHSLLFF